MNGPNDTSCVVWARFLPLKPLPHFLPFWPYCRCLLQSLLTSLHRSGMFIVWWERGRDGRNEEERERRDELKMNISRDLLRVGSTSLMITLVFNSSLLTLSPSFLPSPPPFHQTMNTPQVHNGAMRWIKGPNNGLPLFRLFLGMYFFSLSILLTSSISRAT